MDENKTILVVDDEQEALEGYKDFLTESISDDILISARIKKIAEKQTAFYCNILVAGSGEEAIKILKNEMENGRRIACGFFDVVMPGGIDGIETIKRIREIDRDLICTIVTAYQDRSVSDINSTIFPGHEDEWDYLNKPFNKGEIIQKARNMLSSWNRRRREEMMTKQALHNERILTIGMFTCGIVHDLSNLLQVTQGQIPIIEMNVELLKNVLLSTNINAKENSEEWIRAKKEVDKLFSSLDDTVKSIEYGNNRIYELLRNLNRFSKKGGEEKMLYDVKKGIDSTLELLSFKYKFGKMIKVIKEYSDIPMLMCNPIEINQVLANILGNGCQAVVTEGWIRISIALVDNKIIIKIGDSGGGIPQDIIDKIFQPFFTTKGIENGTGLGLFFSKQLVEKHGGNISVENGEEGAIFKISFNANNF